MDRSILLGYLHFYPFVVMCDRPRDMDGNVFPRLLGSPYFNVLSVGSLRVQVQYDAKE
jgi:hypothetical protein